MKPDFEKMAEDCYNPSDAAILLREAYATGYRDGQERMRERATEAGKGFYSLDRYQESAAGDIGGLTIEEPPA